MRSHLNLRLICVYGACIHKIINKQIIVSFTHDGKRNATSHTKQTDLWLLLIACPMIINVTLKLAGVKLLLATKRSIHTKNKKNCSKNKSLYFKSEWVFIIIIEYSKMHCIALHWIPVADLFICLNLVMKRILSQTVTSYIVSSQ